MSSTEIILLSKFLHWLDVFLFLIQYFKILFHLVSVTYKRIDSTGMFSINQMYIFCIQCANYFDILFWFSISEEIDVVKLCSILNAIARISFGKKIRCNSFYNLLERYLFDLFFQFGGLILFIYWISWTSVMVCGCKTIWSCD